MSNEILTAFFPLPLNLLSRIVKYLLLVLVFLIGLASCLPKSPSYPFEDPEVVKTDVITSKPT